LSRETTIVSGGFLTLNPDYPRLFPQLLNVLLAHGDIYTPQFVELGEYDNYKTIPFVAGDSGELAKKWETQPHDQPGWDLQRRSPVSLSVIISKVPLRFNFVDIHLEREYLKDSQKLAEFLQILKDFYNILHPAYGYARLNETGRTYQHNLGRIRIGIDLLRALPDIYWCNFLGPDYVEMFGLTKLLAAPCYSVERLADGGAILLLSPSPHDYMDNPEGFERQREDLKRYLGFEAFDTGDLSYHGKVPKFRYLDERNRKLAESSHEYSQASSDWLSRTSREEWEEWLRDNELLSREFVKEMKLRNITLDSSDESLARLDNYIHSSNKIGTRKSMELLKKAAAYVSQMVIREIGASWSFRQSDELPSLRLGDIQVSPLARAQKVFQENETFEHWYRFITSELVPSARSGKASIR